MIVYRFDRQPVEGMVHPGAYLLAAGIELITVGGSLQNTPFEELKAVCFVSEVGRDLFEEDKMFERRPKVPGLWTRFTFRDGDQLDGILSHNLLEWPEAGYLITPPHAGATRQRVFLPRAALIGTELRGVVGRSAVASKQRAVPKQGERDQLSMFER